MTACWILCSSRIERLLYYACQRGKIAYLVMGDPIWSFRFLRERWLELVFFYVRTDSSSANGWEEEVRLQVQALEVLLLTYKEESSSAGEIVRKDGEAPSSSVLGCGQEELEMSLK
ncbi:hypothetical protein RIF29_16776 [Crotalaria pallida]|uniref:Uncharacterized protein n=1 Tax=Crotalaria pallida TaxID=3830 RepID=A0AAN9FJF1_CROPI